MHIDLRALPKIRDSWTYLYLEHCKIEQDLKSIAMFDAAGKTPIPCSMLSVLMLGPGTSISHAAVKILAENGCLLAWVGEEGVRYYAQGLGETRSSQRLLRQAYLCSNPSLRLAVVKKMYEMRFKEVIPAEWTLQQIRGREGVRVRDAYSRASAETGVEWKGRNYSRNAWSATDPVNRALSSANSCLYGICHAAIVAAGYSPGLGFIHTGKMLSFVYDIADLYKMEMTVPAAFHAAKSNNKNIEREVRIACRDMFRETRLLQRIVDDLNTLMSVGGSFDMGDDPSYDEDAAKPGQLWNGRQGAVEGGVSYSDEKEV